MRCCVEAPLSIPRSGSVWVHWRSTGRPTIGPSMSSSVDFDRSSVTIRSSRHLSAPCAGSGTGSSEEAMSERAWLLYVRQSVFTKLVAIMLALTAILLVLVFGFFRLYVGPMMNASIDGVVHEYIHTVAATAPSYAQAKEISRRRDVQTRYE